MNTSYFRVASLAILFSLSTTSMAFADGQAYSMAYKFVKGDVKRASVSLDIRRSISSDPNPTPQYHIDLVYSKTVDSIDAATGNANVTVAFLSNTGTFNGQPLPADVLSKVLPSSMSEVVTTTGDVLSTQIPGGQNPNPLPLGIYALLPAKPVAIGESWTGSTQSTTSSGDTSYKSTLRSVSMSGGDELADISSTFVTKNQPVPTPPGINGSGSTSVVGSLDITFDINSHEVKTAGGTVTVDTVWNPAAAAGAPAPTPIKIHQDMKIQATALKAAQ